MDIEPVQTYTSTCLNAATYYAADVWLLQACSMQTAED